MLHKLQFTLREVAAEWSRFTGRTVNEIDILQIATHSLLPHVLLAQGIKLNARQERKHPSLALHFYTPHSIKLKPETGKTTGEFIGRIFVDVDQLAQIMEHGYIMVGIGYDTDTMQILHFVQPIKMRRGDLVVTAANKAAFEVEFLGVAAK